MKKKFLLLALIAPFSISLSVFAEENKDAKISGLPDSAITVLTDIYTNIENENNEAKNIEDNISRIKKNKSGLSAADFNDFMTSNIESLKKKKNLAAEFEDAANVLKNHFDTKYNKSLMNKLTFPIRYVAHLIANNNNVAFALEVTGIAGISYVIYKSFFAQKGEDKNEDSL